ncbi:MAG: hypothetical protein ACR2RV_15850 [Verrucomicrobiales bacterium]
MPAIDRTMMMQRSAISLCWLALLLTAGGTTRALTFVHQPLTTLGTDVDPGIIIARVPVLTNAVPEGLLAHVASPSRLLQDESADIPDSNLLSMLGLSLSAEYVGGSEYLVTLDLSRVGDPSIHGVALVEVVDAAIACINRTVVDTNLFHAKKEGVVWTLKLIGDEQVLKPLANRQKRYRPRESNRGDQGNVAEPTAAEDSGAKENKESASESGEPSE